MSQFTPGKEFERRFWVLKDRLSKVELYSATRTLDIRQAYLAMEPTSVRIRIIDGKAVEEIKGVGNAEYGPYDLPFADAQALVRDHRVGDVIIKTRYEIPARFGRLDLKWEIDVYKGANVPLVVVEIETPEADTPLDPVLFPAWVGDEITGDPVFEALMKNKNLALKPYRDWTKRLRALAERHMRERFR